MHYRHPSFRLSRKSIACFNFMLGGEHDVMGTVTSTVLRGAFISVIVAMGDGLHLRVDLPSKDAQLFAPGCSVMVRIADEPMLCTARRVECVA